MLPEGAAWSDKEKVNLRNASEAALPTSYNSEMNDEDADKLATQQLKVSGRGVVINV